MFWMQMFGILIKGVDFINTYTAAILGGSLIALGVAILGSIVGTIIIIGPWMTLPGLPWVALVVCIPIVFLTFTVSKAVNIINGIIKIRR